MPTYEYECRECGHEFELIQRMTDAPRKRCPKCRGKVVRKPGTGAGVIFRGSGFYQTDYRSDEYRKKAKAESPTGGDSAGKAPESPAPAAKSATREAGKGAGSGEKGA